MCVASRLTTTSGTMRSHPRAVEARDTQIGRDGQVPGAVDEIPKPVVVALLRAGRDRHGDDLRPFARTAQLLEDDAGRSPAVTTTRAGKCRMSVGTAPLQTGEPLEGELHTSVLVCNSFGEN